ncbi:MAG: hypothetical protein DCC71_07745 [Proteobacteria bacterium]|nr:MAG: hypothetical protein DCC71_07745 [Pseudomonadota bacterium]
MSSAVCFPSVDWFERLANAMRKEVERFQELGTTDCTMVVKVDLGALGTRIYEIGFEGFEITEIRELSSLEQAKASHFVVEGSLEAWREMIENIRRNGAPDLEHTLNYLTLPDVPLRVSGPDQLEIDAFYRYNETIQRFFNGAAGIATRYERVAI